MGTGGSTSRRYSRYRGVTSTAENQKVARMAEDTLSLVSSFAKYLWEFSQQIYRSRLAVVFLYFAMSSTIESNNNQPIGLEIVFDRPSRTYHPGERVSGKLIITPNGLGVVCETSWREINPCSNSFVLPLHRSTTE